MLCVGDCRCSIACTEARHTRQMHMTSRQMDKGAEQRYAAWELVHSCSSLIRDGKAGTFIPREQLWP